ncbi:GLUG motif-containing protein [Halobacteriaceae archaeon SHR40]|uniref:beta strand repeat-containing protein n=1 Tax=Halovenus amylolytica TaxID=2500550 RepID=UPI000FE3D6CA
MNWRWTSKVTRFLGRSESDRRSWFGRVSILLMVASMLIGGIASESGVAVAALSQGDDSVTSLAGAGTATDPYQITTAADLQAMADDLDAHYVLASDVDASETAAWNGGRGFVPVGTDTDRFRGSFDGNGYTISGLTIDRPATDKVGLFGVVVHAVVADVRFENASIVGRNDAGTLVGEGEMSTVTDVAVAGTVTGADRVGGVVGHLESYSQVVDTSAAVTVRGEDRVGGLVGRAGESNLVRNASASGSVTGELSVGGLVGANWRASVVIDATATGDVTGVASVGGLVGENIGSGQPATDIAFRNAVVMRSSATGDVTGGRLAGGLVGENRQGTVIDSSATGEVVATRDIARAGGLVGNSYSGLVTGSVATGRVTAPGSSAIAGGLVGEQTYTSVVRSAATGRVAGGNNAGGLVGNSADLSLISRSYATGRVTGDLVAGGLAAGNQNSYISRSYATGPVVSARLAGGLVGTNIADSDIAGSYWDVETSGQTVGVGIEDGTGNGTGLSMARMTGPAARDGMATLEFPAEWRATETYPVLAWQVDRGPGTVEGVLAQGDGETAGTPQEPGTPTEDPAGTVDDAPAELVAMAGTGTLADPYRITDVSELQAMAADLSAHYVLAGDIDASGFTPVGPFSGSLDGDGHVVSNLQVRGTGGIFTVIDRPSGGRPDHPGDVRDLRLENVQVTSDSVAGGLAGENLGTVTGVTVTGSVDGVRGVGGLVGINRGTVTDSVSSAVVRGEEKVGGLVGSNTARTSVFSSAGLVTGSTATGDVTGGSGTSGRDVGGLVGDNFNGNVVDSTATGDVDSGGIGVGGLVGRHLSGVVIGSVATGDVAGPDQVGGLVGVSERGPVLDSAAKGNGAGATQVGGLVGFLEYSVLAGSTATGNVTGTTEVGGLVGWNFESTTSRSYARGSVDGSARVGGLVGQLLGGTVHGSYAAGPVLNRGGGGLVGQSSVGTVAGSYWDRETTTRSGSSGGGTRLTTAQMTGDAPREHMRGFDVPADWYLTDSYPVLAWEDAGPFFTVTVAETTASIVAEETLAVAVNVTNYGARGAQSVTLTDTDFTGGHQDAVRVTLDPGESTSVTLSWTPRRADGGVTGVITVGSANDTAPLNVTVSEATTQPPTGEPPTTGDGPGFGLLVAVLAVGLAVLLGRHLRK